MCKPCLYKLTVLLSFLFLLSSKQHLLAQSRYGKNDTILVAAVVYEGDTIPAKMMDEIQLLAHYTAAQSAKLQAWTRLRNAVYVTYPYAKRASIVINDINAHLAGVTDGATRRKYIRSREKELRQEFTAPLTNLSVYQGKVLMKLINRETGNNCYEIIKEYKGGLTARLYQTVAFFFDEDLKEPYAPQDQDAEMEKIVLEVQKMYGYKS
jgi:hypothetical protein